MTTTRLARAVSCAALFTSVLANVGCAGGGDNGGNAGSPLQNAYFNRVDPCWPERYSYQARQETLSPFANMVSNGQITDQTIKNVDFDYGTDKLNAGGMAKLDAIARRRPVDGHVYLQTARDLSFDNAKPTEYVKGRSDLDGKRVATLAGYLQATTSGRVTTPQFDVAIIDPGDNFFNSAGPARSVRGYPTRFASGIGGLIQVNSAGTGGVNQTANVTGAAGGVAATGGTVQGNLGTTGAPGGTGNPGAGGGQLGNQ